MLFAKENSPVSSWKIVSSRQYAVAAVGLTTIWALHFVVRRTLQHLERLSKVGVRPWKALLVAIRQTLVRPILLEAPENVESENDCSVEALLVLFPDEHAPPVAYQELARLIRQKSLAQNVRLHIGISHFGANRPSAWWGEIDASASIAVLRSRINRRLDHVVLFGHGQGTETILEPAPHTALIRFGSLRGMQSLYHYPKPCLTLLGDRDRQIPYVQVASLLDEWEYGTSHDTATSVPIPKPILLLPGLNHVCLVDPTKANFYLHNQKDLCLSKDMTREIALDQVACVTTSFVRIVLGGKAQEWNELSRLSTGTRQLLLSYQKLCTRRKKAEFAVQAQRHIYGHSDTPFPISVHFASKVSDFAYTKPQIGEGFLRTFLWEQNPLKINGIPILRSKTWAVKCKSRKSLQSVFDKAKAVDAADDFDSWTHIFQDLNQRTFEYVLRSCVTQEERVRFVESGLRLEFGPDQNFMKRSASDWLFADMIVHENADNDTIVVSSPVGYTTCSSALPLKFRGMHYGKTLSPAQCYEWIVSGCWRFQKLEISETTTAPPGFSLTHQTVSASTWDEIRSWLDLDFASPELGLDLSQKSKNIPWEVSTVAQNRPVAQFGFRYNYVTDTVEMSPNTLPIPAILKRLLLEGSSLDGLPPAESFTQCIVNAYLPNSSHIPWHTDHSDFGPVIVVYTFGEGRPLKLRRKNNNARVKYTHYLAETRHLSRYVLSGAAREEWEHSVPTGCGWRISITFRSWHGKSTVQVSSRPPLVTACSARPPVSSLTSGLRGIGSCFAESLLSCSSWLMQKGHTKRWYFGVSVSLFIISFLLPTSQSFLLSQHHRRPHSVSFSPILAKPQDQSQNDQLLSLLSPPDSCNVGRLSPTDLAYIGDVVYELFVRSKKVWPPKRTQDLQNQVVRLVRAEYQAALVAHLRQTVSTSTAPLEEDGVTLPSFVLLPAEEQVLQRGRNAGTKTNHRKSNPVAYQDATALEALLGYLYISDKPRCNELLQWMDAALENYPPV